MSWISLLAVYFIVYWLTIFWLLPIGNRPPEEHEMEEGQANSAPVNPNLKKKFLWNFLVAAIVTGLFWGAVELEWLSWDYF